MTEAISKSLKINEITPSEGLVNAHFFNSSDFLVLKSFEVKGWQLKREGQPITQIFFHINNGVAISGYQATFGSFDINSKISKHEFEWFVQQLVTKLKDSSVSRIEISHYPMYEKSLAFISKVLILKGFKIKLREINQHIQISKREFSKIAKRNELKKIKQSVNKEFKFEIVDITYLSEIYKLIVDTRLRKNYRISMSYEELENAIKINSNNYVLFVIKDEMKIIAASVSVVINKNVLYNFYHADDIAYRNFSPISFLVKNIYDYCFKNKYSILDLGISSVQEELNQGLFDFKRNLGADVTDKIVYSLSL